MIDALTTAEQSALVAAAAPPASIAAGTARASPHPSAARLLGTQIRYQAKLLLSSPRGLVIGVGLPIILLVASKGKAAHPDVAGYAVFGLTMTAWTTFGMRLVGARESGVLKRWWATPLPRWCYFVGSILATALVSVAAGTATVLAAFLIYGHHLGDGPQVYVTSAGAAAVVGVCFMGAIAFAAAVTAFTSFVPSVEAALPTLMLTYFPLVVVSGVLFSIAEPHWLSTFASYLPAQPLVDAMAKAVRHVAGGGSVPFRDVAVLAGWTLGGLVGAVVLFRWDPHRSTAARRQPAKARS